MAFSEYLNFKWDKSEKIHLKEPKYYFLTPVFWQDFFKNICEGALDFHYCTSLWFWDASVQKEVIIDQTLKVPLKHLQGALKAPYLYFKIRFYLILTNKFK